MPRKKQTDDTGVVKQKKERLTDKERLYCHYYVQSFNQVKSYMQAFDCTRLTACKHAYQKHAKKAVQEEINRLLDKKYADIGLRQESIIQKHLDIAHADINDFVEMSENGELRLKDLAFTDGTVVSELQYSPQTGAFRIKLNDRQKSLDWLAANMSKAESEDEGTGVVVLADVEN